MNRSIYMTPGGAEEWTLSVTHDDTAVDAYAAVFEAMAAELSGRGGSFCVAAELTR